MRRKAQIRNPHRTLLAAAVVVAAIVLGLANVVQNLFMLPVTRDLRVSRSLYALSCSLGSGCYVLSNAAFAALYGRFGFRRPATLVMAATALAYVGYACARSLAPFFLGAVLFGLGQAFVNNAGMSQLVNNWFVSHRGKVLGVILAAGALGGAAWSVAMSAMIQAWGWRAPMWVAAAFLAAGTGIVFVFLRDHPRELAAQPYRAPEAGAAAAPAGEGDWEGASMRVLRHKPVFYLTMLCVILCAICTFGALSTYVTHLQDQGLSPWAAGVCNSVLMIGLAVAQIVVGALCDRFRAFRAALLCLACGVVGIFLLSGARNVGTALAAAALLSFGACMVGFIQPLLALDMFGRCAHSAVMGVMLAMVSAGNILVAPLVNLAYDRMGSYSPVLMVLGVAAAAVTGLFWLTFRLDAAFRRQSGA